MISKLECQLGTSKKNYFSYYFDKQDKASVHAAVEAYREFYENYRKTHSISARAWRFPTLYIDGVARYAITPNGNWDKLREEN